MIDITVDNNEVEVEMKKYHSFNNKDVLVAMIEDIINKAKFSGESITLWRAYYDAGERQEMKKLIREW